MINLGIVGLGNQWESRYRPALKKLSNRLSVKAIYTPVYSRAKQVSEEFNALALEGINMLANVPQIHGVLLLDTGWAQVEVLKLLLKLGKPVFIAESINLNTSDLLLINQEVYDLGLTIMPEMGRRYMPSSARLQELMATQLGRPREIRIKAPVPCPGNHQLIQFNRILRGLFDWCYYIGRSQSKDFEIHSAQKSPCPGISASRVKIQYEQSKLMHSPAILNLEIHCISHEYGNSTSSLKEQFHCEIICEHGVASIETPRDIQWQVDASTNQESLSSDRSDIEVMLDHFSRRVIGGLVPIPDLNDYCRSSSLIEKIFNVTDEENPHLP